LWAGVVRYPQWDMERLLKAVQLRAKAREIELLEVRDQADCG